jgi:hypothetical protein
MDKLSEQISAAAARGAASAPERPLPSWVTLGFAMLVPLAGSAVGYGEQRARVTALEQRLDLEAKSNRERFDRVESDARTDRSSTAAALDRLASKMEELGRVTERICARVQCGGGSR